MEFSSNSIKYVLLSDDACGICIFAKIQFHSQLPDKYDLHCTAHYFSLDSEEYDLVKLLSVRVYKILCLHFAIVLT